jgi:hypothetical protein
MNGFEHLLRRVIDYTAAGQWQEVYDGPIEECEEYRLAAENAKLRELVKHTWLFANRAHEAAYELCPDRSDPHALATISALTLNAQDVAVRMCELGIEVDG